MRVFFLGLACLTLCLAAQPGMTQDRFPLAPADTSSPRATIASFLESSRAGIIALRSGGPKKEIIGHFTRVDSTLDLSETSASGSRARGTEAGLLLYEVLSRIELPPMSEIPGGTIQEDNPLPVWVVPNTEITIVLREEEDGAARYLFSADTVRRVADYYERVKHLPLQDGFLPGTYDIYIDLPNLIVPYLWVQALPDWVFFRIAKNPLWKWAAILLIGIGILALARRCLAILGSQSKGSTSKLSASVAFMVGAVALDYIAVNIVGLRFEARFLFSTLLRILVVGFLLASVFYLFDVLTGSISRSGAFRHRISPAFVQLAGRVFAIFVVFTLAVEAAEFFGLNVTPLIAGLGVGGLAVALAARPTLENVIGGFILFADRPVRIGEFCQFGDQIGTVEEIGLRSTKVRRLDERLVTIPNATFAQFEIVNFSKVRERLYKTMLQFRYETTPDQLRYLLAETRRMLLAHPMVSDEKMHVRFDGFGAHSLDVELFAYFRTQNWLTFKEIREDINLQIMDIVESSGTGFAFPSQTTYLARDGGIDKTRTGEVAGLVAAWRDQGALPFPDFSDEERAQVTDSMEYPSAGSARTNKD